MAWNFPLSKYPENMKGMLGTFTTTNAGGGRVRQADSDAMEAISIRTEDSKVTLHMARSDFYIHGFSNSHGRYRFSDKETEGTSLGYKCSYTDAAGLTLFSGSTGTMIRGYGSMITAIQMLAMHGGTTTDANSLKPHLGVMIYLTSESFRFRNIFHRMCNAVTQNGNKVNYTFNEFKPWVTNWSKLSKGTLPTVPTGAVQPRPMDLCTAYE